jgi:hypothetical protein
MAGWNNINSLKSRQRKFVEQNEFRERLSIVSSTRRYETWLASHTPIVKPDLRLKHQRMSESAFLFLRATFYRWTEIWPHVCPDLAKAPGVLAVGDLHVENFGTWRDTEGRLVWGVNDFDEAAMLPYTHDLVRLATSVLFAIDEGHLSLTAKDGCAILVDGYRKSLAHGGLPFVLEEEHGWLRHIALGELRDPVVFWQKMEALPRIKGKIPSSARKALEDLLPQRGLDYRMVHRVAGVGSLGRPRLVALAESNGGEIAREAKALVPSAVHCARGTSQPRHLYQVVIGRAVRSPDPFVQIRGGWIVRRLSPHCCRIDLSVLPRGRDELRLLFAMGWETANIHLGSRSALKDIRRHLVGLHPDWLLSAAKSMASVVKKDWGDWKKSMRR